MEANSRPMLILKSIRERLNSGSSDVGVTPDRSLEAIAHGDPNFGDCFSYALAKATGEPLLFKGEDFTHTDIAAVAY